MKRKLTAVFMAAIVISLLSAGSISYYTKTDTASNVITAGNIDIKICQTPSPEEEIRVMPGEKREMILQAENIGDHPAYVRIKVEVCEEGIIELDINEEDWTYEGGYYYYKRELKAGEKTEALFTEVGFCAEYMDDSYQDEEITLDILLYGVQSENNGSEPLKAAGWPEEVR